MVLRQGGFMRVVVAAFAVALWLQAGAAGSPDAGCEAIGGVQFVCGHSGPEDMVLVPGSAWVVASGYTVDDGSIRIVSTKDFKTTTLVPAATPRERFDSKTYASCPGPILGVEQKKFRTHGLSLKPGQQQVHTLFAVHHGTRESVEVFELDAKASPPTLTWVGCVVAPPKTNLNAVSALPEGFVATSYQTEGRGKPRADAYSEEITGELWEWHSATGWTMVPGSDTAGPNGLEISKDGKWLFIGSTSSQSVIRLSRGQTPPDRKTVPVGFSVDNVRWAPDGSLLVAGFILAKPNAPGSSRVAKLDPNTLKATQVLDAPSMPKFAVSTAALVVGNELWVGSVRGDRIARYPGRGSMPSKQ
jgi:sugar lactone lactonase YvrE